jgi:hypothetical protein
MPMPAIVQMRNVAPDVLGDRKNRSGTKRYKVAHELVKNQDSPEISSQLLPGMARGLEGLDEGPERPEMIRRQAEKLTKRTK